MPLTKRTLSVGTAEAAARGALGLPAVGSRSSSYRARRAGAKGFWGPCLARLALRRLILETRPSWDGSKVTQVDSLEPLRGLPLGEINMFGVRPASKTVDDLLAIPTLKRARWSKFAAKEIKEINAVIPNEFVEWQEPTWGSAAEVAATKEALPTGISFRAS